MKLDAEQIRHCMEGVIPGVIATCAPDGTPNVSFFSQVEYVDSEHVALSFQFFNKTHENILKNPFATASVPNARTGANYCLSLEYLRTETEGPLFERMKAKLAGIATIERMNAVFRLLGSDVYRVLEIEGPDDDRSAPADRQRNLLAVARTYSDHVARCADLEELLDTTLADIDTLLGIKHAMILMLDAPGQRLFTVASRGYAAHGVGSEVPLGRGIIGTAAHERCPIRIGFTAPEYAYSRAVHESLGHSPRQLETTITFPGLEAPQSQIAVPILAPQRTVGVLYADSDQQLRFDYEEEDALMVVAGLCGAAAVTLTGRTAEHEVTVSRATAKETRKSARTIVVRHFAENDSVFIEDAYLIKGIAGAIFWKLVNEHVETGRVEFSNKELRLDPRLRFPDVNDNLEARLILLRRRLADHRAPVQLIKTGRGRFRISVDASLELQEVRKSRA